MKIPRGAGPRGSRPGKVFAIKAGMSNSYEAVMHLPFLFSAFQYLFLCTLMPHAFALGVDGPVLNGNISAFINQLLTEYESPGGIAVAVVSQDLSGTWSVETQGYGVASLANGSNVTENTLFPIGSNSKVVPGVVSCFNPSHVAAFLAVQRHRHGTPHTQRDAISSFVLDFQIGLSRPRFQLGGSRRFQVYNHH